MKHAACRLTVDGLSTSTVVVGEVTAWKKDKNSVCIDLVQASLLFNPTNLGT
jgi:hypothetical protein